MKNFCMIFLSFAIYLSAAIVPVERAQKVAMNYYTNYAPSAEKGNNVQKILTKEYMEQPTWYVVQFTKGWVIVSADDAVRPILGYSFDGKIDDDLNNLQNPFVHRFSFYDRQIVHNVREKGYVDEKSKADWKDIENNRFPDLSSSKRMNALLETEWHQRYPFNAACPEGSITGSVATAMTQIMRYHQSPRTGFGLTYYTDDSGDITGLHYISDYHDFYYDWSLMTTLDGNDLTQQEIDELAEINYHTGVSVYTDYNTESATASLEDAAAAFDGHFGYGGLDYGPVYVNLDSIITDPSSYYETIMENLDDNTPLLWGSSGGEDISYAFVLDGYHIDTENSIYEYHFNWGWGGDFNGWFRLDDLTPGSSNYTSSQECVRHLIPYWPNAMWAPPQNLQCTIEDLENVNMQWEWIDSDWLILSRFDILLDGKLIDSVPDSVMSYYFEGVCVGKHTFTAEAVFGIEYYPEWYSSPAGETLEILPDENFPVPYFTQEASVELYNRQKVGLAWAKPFIGTEYLSEGFEESQGTYEMVTGIWTQKGSYNFPPDSLSDLTDAGWKYISRNGGTFYEQYVYEGYWAAYCEVFAPPTDIPYVSLISRDEIELTGNPVISFWLRSYYSDAEIQIISYSGDFTETDPSNYIELIATIKPDTLDTWEYKHVSLPEGTYRIGIVKDTNSGGSVIDNMFLGSDTYPNGNQPVSYNIYRNGVLLNNIPVSGLYEQYEDDNFTENDNEYFIRAVYPTGLSLKSASTTAYIDVNPVPHYLTGIYNNTNDKVDLSWYYPGHYPPHWFGFKYDTDTPSFFLWGSASYLRSCFTNYDPAYFDMTFPIHIEKVSASFFEDVGHDNYWTSDQFRFEIGVGSFWDENIVYTSPWLTADPDGESVEHTLSEILTVNDCWYVSVVPGDMLSGTPSLMTNDHKRTYDETEFHSYRYTSNTPTSSGYTSSLYFEDFSILCYGYNDQPLITKNKGLDSYNVYKNGAFLDNTAEKNYADANPLSGETTYYVTAVYSDPPGESAPSNVVMVTITSIEDNVPYETSLSQNYPNPFNPETNIKFSIASDTKVSLKIFNTAGQLVAVPVDRFMKRGSYNANMNASKLSGGVYIYRLEADGKELSKKMTVLK